MKLKTKLLPLVGVATACAAVAPIALTSCTNSEKGWINLMNKYKATVTPLDNQTLDETEVNKAYFGDEENGWKSSDQVIAQVKDDYCWWASKSAINDGDYSSAKINFEYFYVNHQTFTPSDPEQSSYVVPTFNFKMNYRYEYTTSYSPGETENVVESGTKIFANVPYMIEYKGIPHGGPADQAWMIAPPEFVMRDNENSASPIIWSCSVNKTTTTTYEDTEAGTKYTTTKNKELIYYKGCGLGDFMDRDNGVALNAVSHYLYSVQHKE